MHDANRALPGRPRRVTSTNLTEAGIELTLPKVTVKSVADKLGVSIVAVYNNIENVEALRVLVAEEILARWTVPTPRDGDPIDRSLAILADALKDLVHRNPGIAGYLANKTSLPGFESAALTASKVVKTQYAQLYGLAPVQTEWVVETVAEHAVALAELAHVTENWGPADRWALSMRAVIVGALALVTSSQFTSSQPRASD
ncbi:hypothetical protein [Rhodococcoides yunnanense]|uniref:hypothetical protein n=1 Tax=Rhodococcoides yunnanense TaxID=278209 RepID=UPI000932EB17|nr:hypothetical protein [Rhodococcus yunnanensis]